MQGKRQRGLRLPEFDPPTTVMAMVYHRQVWPQTEGEDEGRRGENFKVSGGHCALFLVRARQDSHCSACVHDCGRMWLEEGGGEIQWRKC